jgi:hypothetical protein
VYYNASQSWDSTVNDTVSIAFTGTTLAYCAVTGPGHGIAAVAVDGAAPASVDLYKASKTGNVLVWTSPTLPYGSHVLQIRITGTKSASSTGTVITLDRADISN